MAQPPKHPREAAWLTVRQLANALDLTTDFVRREVLRYAPADCIRREGRRIIVHGRTVLENYFAPPEAPALTDDDYRALMFGANRHA